MICFGIKALQHLPSQGVNGGQKQLIEFAAFRCNGPRLALRNRNVMMYICTANEFAFVVSVLLVWL